VFFFRDTTETEAGRQEFSYRNWSGKRWWKIIWYDANEWRCLQCYRRGWWV